MSALRRIFPMCPLTGGLCTGERIEPWVAWHSPHSLTWSWILRGSWVGLDQIGFVWWRSGSYWMVGLRRVLLVGSGVNNGGRQWQAQFFGFGLEWSRQRPMWFRDLYRDELRRQDEQRNQARPMRQRQST